MPAPSPIRAAFDSIAREPALPLAEITWRWCFSAAAWLIGIVALLEYLNSVPVSWRERLLLESSDPLLAFAALAHALRGSALHFALGVVLAGAAIASLWMLASALGRLITLTALLPAPRKAYPALFGLSFLRAALFWAALLAALAGLILAGFAAPSGDAAPNLVVAAVLWACIWLVWALLNWLLSLAAIFAVRDGDDTFGSIAAAVDLVRGAFGELVLASLPFVLLHYLALAAAVVSGVLIFDVMARLSPNAAWALMAVAFAYFAYTDFLYITRLAAYVSLADGNTFVVPATNLPAKPVTPKAESQLPSYRLPAPNPRLLTPDS